MDSAKDSEDKTRIHIHDVTQSFAEEQQELATAVANLKKLDMDEFEAEQEMLVLQSWADDLRTRFAQSLGISSGESTSVSDRLH